ncbi:hypothetical protein RLOC_00012388 [Lonchura striata]|uniref:Uncharacterized protein n=1 Tax=Lonchura striata TaxID=40157 RepID=A0A218V683_9PASE|nr:hypothetical protein RLOC_00012388 [Lonchura striata domestica]
MQTRNQMWQKKGKKRGCFLLKAAAVLKGITFSLKKRFFTLLFFTLQTAVGTQFFMFLVHSKLIANCLCEVALS